jgi:hypothetical protein
MAPSLSTLALDAAHGPLDAWFDRGLIEETGIFHPTAVAGLRLGARRLPRGSRVQRVCEAATVMALSVHVLHDLFCRRLDASFARYRRPGVLDVRDGMVPDPVGPAGGVAAL